MGCKQADLASRDLVLSLCVHSLCPFFFFKYIFFLEVSREREREIESVIVQQQRRAMPRNALYIAVGETDAPLQLCAAYLHCDSSDSDV